MSDVLDVPPAPPAPAPPGMGRAADERVNRVTSIPFALIHALPLLAIFTGDDAGRGAVRGAVLRPDVLHHGGLPPLLRPPQLQARPGPAVRDGVRWRDGRAEGGTLVGRPPSPPP